MSEVKKPRVFFLGISEGTKAHVKDHRVWSTDYELVEKIHFDKAIEALKEADKLIVDDHLGAGLELTDFILWKRRLKELLKELGYE